jgi:hypothetical protein
MDTALAISNRFATLGLQSSGSKLNERDVERLSALDEIYLIGDMDSTGIAAIENAEKVLPKEKVFRVTLGNNSKVEARKDIGDLRNDYRDDFAERLRALMLVAKELKNPLPPP